MKNIVASYNIIKITSLKHFKLWTAQEEGMAPRIRPHRYLNFDSQTPSKNCLSLQTGEALGDPKSHGFPKSVLLTNYMLLKTKLKKKKHTIQLTILDTRQCVVRAVSIIYAIKYE